MEGHIYTDAEHIGNKGVITPDYPEQIKAQLDQLPPTTTKIIHHIASPGGNCYAGYKAFHVLMKAGKPIKSIIEGEAQSMATFLAIAPAAEVEILDPSTFMIHEPFYPGGVEGGTIDQLQENVTELSQIKQAMAEAYAKKTGKSVEEMMALMKKTTRYDARGAKEAGFVDLVTAPSKVTAQFIESIKTELSSLKSELMNFFKKNVAPVAEAPKAVDLKTKDGKMVNVQSENGDLVGKPVTIDGKPAEGTYDLEDGRALVCVAGVVKEIKGGDAPQESPEQKLQAKIAELEGQLAGIKAAEEQKTQAAEKEKAEAEKVELNKQLEDTKQKAAALAQEVENLKNKEVGAGNKPFEGMAPNRQPVGAGGKDRNIEVMATRTFLADHMGYLERYYPGGKYSDGTRFTDYRTGGPSAVSILETNLNYTWNGVLDTDLYFKPTLSSPALSELATIDLGSADKKRYHIAPVADKVLKPYIGCDQPVTGTSLNITSKYIQIKHFRMKEKWCVDDFTDLLTGQYNVLAQEWLKTGNAQFDPAGTPINTMIMNLLKDSLRRDVWRRVSFGDTTSSNADYNQIDGYWQSLIDQSGASNYCVYRYGSALGTGTLAANAAQTYFEGIYNNSALLLKQEAIDKGTGKFLVTRSIWENYYSTLAATGAVTEQAFTNAVKGAAPLTFRGIPVIPVTIWDKDLADSNNPLSATTRHLISFTTSDNHIIGVQNTGDLQAIKSWFSDDDNVRYYSAQMAFGFLGALHCELTSISY